MTKTTAPLVGRNGNGGVRPASTESVADILERELDATIHEWMGLVDKEPELSRIPLNYQERTGHLPNLLHDVIARLRLDKGTRAPISVAAGHHGDLRHKQGYTVANVVDEPESCRSVFLRRCTKIRTVWNLAICFPTS